MEDLSLTKRDTITPDKRERLFDMKMPGSAFDPGIFDNNKRQILRFTQMPLR